MRVPYVRVCVLKMGVTCGIYKRQEGRRVRDVDSFPLCTEACGLVRVSITGADEVESVAGGIERGSTQRLGFFRANMPRL